MIFDLGIGKSDVRPTADSGYAAAAAAKGGRVAQGSVGAGTGRDGREAGMGQGRGLKSGLGTASETLADGV